MIQVFSWRNRSLPLLSWCNVFRLTLARLLFDCTKTLQIPSLYGRSSWSIQSVPQVLSLPLLSFNISLPIQRLVPVGVALQKASSSTGMITWGKLEEPLPVNHHYSAGLKKLVLIAAVHSLECLANATAIDSNQVAKGDPLLDFQACFNLLLSAAVQHDKQSHLTAKRNHRMQHTIN